MEKDVSKAIMAVVPGRFQWVFVVLLSISVIGGVYSEAETLFIAVVLLKTLFEANRLFNKVYVFEDGILCKRLFGGDVYMAFEVLKEEGVCLLQCGKNSHSIKVCLGNEVLLGVNDRFEGYDEFEEFLDKKRMLTAGRFGKPMVQKEWAEKNKNRLKDD